MIAVWGEMPNIKVVGVCSTGERIIQKASEVKHDIILLDGSIIAGDCVGGGKLVYKDNLLSLADVNR